MCCVTILRTARHHISQLSRIHDPCIHTESWRRSLTIAYNTESAYFLLSKTHTICECGQKYHLSGVPGGLAAPGASGVPVAAVGGVGLKIRLSSIVAGCLGLSGRGCCCRPAPAVRPPSSRLHNYRGGGGCRCRWLRVSGRGGSIGAAVVAPVGSICRAVGGGCWPPACRPAAAWRARSKS